MTTENLTRQEAIQASTINDPTIHVILENDELEYSADRVAVSMDDSADIIIDAIAGAVKEEKGIDIRSDFKVRKMLDKNRIYIIPQTTAG